MAAASRRKPRALCSSCLLAASLATASQASTQSEYTSTAAERSGACKVSTNQQVNGITKLTVDTGLESLPTHLAGQIS